MAITGLEAGPVLTLVPYGCAQLNKRRSRASNDRYPHPALVELTGASERLPYKLAKTRAYWRALSPSDRKEQLIAMWAEIANALNKHVPGSADQTAKVHPSSAGFALKAAEDCLDAMVCTWVAIEALAGGYKPFRDEEAAIWIPCRN